MNNTYKIPTNTICIADASIISDIRFIEFISKNLPLFKDPSFKINLFVKMKDYFNDLSKADTFNSIRDGVVGKETLKRLERLGVAAYFGSELVDYTRYLFIKRLLTITWSKDVTLLTCDKKLAADVRKLNSIRKSYGYSDITMLTVDDSGNLRDFFPAAA
jgi:hypothetical protein